MADKTLNTRIKLKYDTQANWNSSTLVLLAGEVAICEIPATSDSGTPSIGIKVGNGSKKFSELPWTQAAAGDVYSWAKASTKPSYTATEISGLENYISGQIQDTDTQYKLTLANGVVKLSSKAKGATTWTEQDSVTLPTYALATGTTNGTVSFNGTNVAVKGLDSAAYTKSTAYATAAQGSNSDTHIASKSNPHSVTKTQVGLSNVTNNAQVKGLASGTTENHIVTWGADGYTVKDSGYTIATSVPANAKFTDTTYNTGNATTAGLTKLYTSTGTATDGAMTQKAVKDAIDATLTAAMEFKGATETLPTNATKGSLYKVTASITVSTTADAEGKGFTAKVGDTIVSDGSGKWYRIPSGDDIEDTWRAITAGGTAISASSNLTISGGTGVSVTGTAEGAVTIGHSNNVAAGSNIGPSKDVSVSAGGSGSITIPKLSYDAQGHITGTGTQTLTINVPTAETFKSVVINTSNGVTGGGTINTNGGSVTISHADKPATSTTASSTVGSSDDRVYVKQIKLDAYGHIIDVTTGTADKNTDTGVTSVTANNGLTQSISGRALTLGISSISTDLLSQGTNTLILNCGTSA